MTIAYMSDIPVHNTHPGVDDYAVPIRTPAGIPLSVQMTGSAAGLTQTGTVTRVAASNLPGALLAANTNRRGAVFANTATTPLYLRFATGAITLTNFSVSLSQHGNYTLPIIGLGTYTGPVSMMHTATSGVGESVATEWT